MNIQWSQKILRELYDQGVRDVICCAGARNSPLVTVLSKTKGMQVHSFFEERSGAFYALGLARRTGRPVAITTTSGTAAAELLPAVIEAFHTGVPLIMLTADRPRRLRGSGAPQAIDQVGLFAKFVGREFDLEADEMFSLKDWEGRSPVHINICFDEPLIDEPVDHFYLANEGVEAELMNEDVETSFAGKSGFSVSSGAEWASLRLLKFFRVQEPLLIIVGTLETFEERVAVTEFLLHVEAPIYLEATSGLRESPELQDLSVISGDKILSWGLKYKAFTRVLRIGGVPTARIWRDLDEPTSAVEVLSLTTLPFSGLSRGELVCTAIAPALESLRGQSGIALKDDYALQREVLLSKDREVAAELENLFRDEPQAEPSLVNALSRLIPDSATVYVGNSLPIREWDFAASRERPFSPQANRGVNGIDGQISTFIGLADRVYENWAILGDLTTMYDLSGPWAFAMNRPGLTLRLVVINNGGGKIFSRIFGTSLFENRHDFEFEHWAKMWRMNYRKWEWIPTEFEGAPAEVIEITPNAEATARFWSRYDQLWIEPEIPPAIEWSP
jgi:2-succinyl-5-enolpyruvyl-6-hydroxy-3-cyclohexene-1-carboxylate synthase